MYRLKENIMDKKNIMNKEEIKKILPHREPMLLVDSMEKEGEYVNAYYHVTGEEYFLKGHYPNNPVVPGVILCEIMGQSSALLVQDLLEGRTPYYTGLDSVRFKKMVHPGDTVKVRARVTGGHGLLVVVGAEAYVNDELCAKGSLTFMMIG